MTTIAEHETTTAPTDTGVRFVSDIPDAGPCSDEEAKREATIATLLAHVGGHELSMANMVSNAPLARDYLFGRLALTSGVYGLLHAQGNSSKTYILQEMLASLALAGVPGCNYDPLRLAPLPAPNGNGWRCVFWSGEDSDAEIWTRFYRIASACGPDGRRALQRNIRVISTLGANPRTLITDEYVQELARTVGAGARMIAFDTLSRFNGRDENSNAEMSDTIARFEGVGAATGAATIATHHDNKAARATDSGPAIGSGFRGASCIWDNARWSATIRTTEDGGRVLIEDKHNLGKRHDDRRLLWTDDEARGPIVAADPDLVAITIDDFEARRKANAKKHRMWTRAQHDAAATAMNARSHGASSDDRI